MKWCTAVNCIDGRVQLPVIKFLRKRLRARHVDLVTEPGPVKALARQNDQSAIESIVRRVQASIHFHESRNVAVIAHHDCAANPLQQSEQWDQVRISVRYLKRRFPEVEVIGLWVDGRGRVSVVPEPAGGGAPGTA